MDKYILLYYIIYSLFLYIFRKVYKDINIRLYTNSLKMRDNTNNNQEFQEVRSRKPQNFRPNRQDVLNKVAAGDINPDEAEKLLRKRLPPRFVVTRTGAIALYNLQRHPIVLYPDQWDKLSSLIRRDILDNYMKKNENIIKRRYPTQNPTYQSSATPEQATPEQATSEQATPEQDTSEQATQEE